MQEAGYFGETRWRSSVADPDPHGSAHFEKPAPDPHQRQKQDPDPLKVQI